MTKNETEKALERILQRVPQFEGTKTMDDIKLVRQTHQSQAEKDRVMRTMTEALGKIATGDAADISDQDRVNIMRKIAKEALSEYRKLGGTQDE